MINLKNKIALVTGGTRGIGKACVEYLVKAGAGAAFTFNVREDIAGSVIFLASDLASHITGSTISVNGGSVL